MLKKVIYYLILIPFSVFSQELDLFNEIETDELTESKLLPNKMIFTQRFLWGEKGLARVLKVSPLNIKNRKTYLLSLVCSITLELLNEIIFF